MRRLGALLLLFVVALPSFAAEPAAEEMTSVPWYRRVFLGERSKPVPPKPVAAAPKPPSRESVARLIADENKVYLDRLTAISKIRRIADEQGDEAMLKKADLLEEQASKVHADRTAKLTATDDRKALEKGSESIPSTAERTTSRRRVPRGDN